MKHRSGTLPRNCRDTHRRSSGRRTFVRKGSCLRGVARPRSSRRCRNPDRSRTRSIDANNPDECWFGAKNSPVMARPRQLCEALGPSPPPRTVARIGDLCRNRRLPGWLSAVRDGEAAESSGYWRSFSIEDCEHDASPEELDHKDARENADHAAKGDEWICRQRSYCCCYEQRGEHNLCRLYS